MKIGILGGTFDPVHAGHLLIAEEARLKLNFKKVLFMPAGEPWLKLENAISPAAHRVEMVRLAIAGKSGFELSTMEIERAGPTYTVDSITELKAELGAGAELFFILGWDNLLQLPHWKEPGKLVGMCRLVAFPRVGYLEPDLDVLEKEVPGLKKSVIELNEPRIDITASDIRKRAKLGKSIAGLVPEVVERYIKEHRLYLD